MKARILLVAAAAVILIFSVTLYVYRDSVARQAANSILRDSGLEITGLAIASIGTNSVRFDELAVRQRGGTEIHIRGVTLPLAASRRQTGTLAIDEVELIGAGGDSSAPNIGGIIESIIALPETIPYPSIRISRLVYAPIHPLTDIEWGASEAGQLLRFRVADFLVSAGIERQADDIHRATLTATDGDDVNALALALGIERAPDGYDVDGQTTVVVQPLLPLLHAYGMLPAGIGRMDGLLRGTLNTMVPLEPAQSFDIAATLKADGRISLAYDIESRSVADVAVVAHETVSTAVSFPSLSWRTELPGSDLVVSTSVVKNVPLSVTGLVCESGIHCSMEATLDTASVSFGDIAVGRLSMAGPVALDVGDVTILSLANSLSFAASDVVSGDTTIARVNLSGFSGAAIDISDDGWRAQSAGARVDLGGVDTLLDLHATLPVSVSDVVVENSGDSARFAFGLQGSDVQLRRGKASLRVPNVQGKLRYLDAKYSLSGRLAMPNGSFAADVGFRHDTTDRSGELTLGNAAIDFATRNAADFVSPALAAGNVVAGMVLLDLKTRWRPQDDGYLLDADYDVVLDGLAGNYGDIAVSGITTRIKGSYDDRGGLAIGPTTTRLDLVDAGIPVSDISLDWRADGLPPALSVSRLDASLLGGALSADPFRYEAAASSAINVRIDHVQLPLMVKLADFERITVEGSVSGEFPVLIRDKKVSIAGGRLAADAPGGVIRYLGGDTGAANAQLGLATRALSNFQFRALSSNVTYSEDGDLQLAMRMEGINPDLDPNQPVVLNLNVEDNIPTLLKSLQAARSVEEILERRVRKD